MRYIVYTAKGIEKIVRKEIMDTFNAEVIELGDKRIIFETAASFNDLIHLKTVDDLGLLLVIEKDTISVNSIINNIEKINLIETKQLLATFRNVEKDNFSITASFAKVKTFKSHDIISAISNYITKKYHWTYTEFDHTNFDIRIFIDQKDAYISIRLTEESLHHRPYKTDSKSGSLKPTVAAAMVYLVTEGEKNLKVVDNFCGSGTILLEALTMGNKIYGGDVDPESVSITRKNLVNLQYTSEDNIKTLDAIKTNWPINYFDCAISNLPWDKQIEIKSITHLYDGTIKEYARIVKEDGTICLLLNKPDLMIKYIRKFIPGAIIETQKIGLLGQNPTIILIKKNG